MLPLSMKGNKKDSKASSLTDLDEQNMMKTGSVHNHPAPRRDKKEIIM